MAPSASFPPSAESGPASDGDTGGRISTAKEEASAALGPSTAASSLWTLAKVASSSSAPRRVCCAHGRPRPADDSGGSYPRGRRRGQRSGREPRWRSASFRSAASASALQFLMDSSRVVSNPADSRTTFFRRKEKNGDKNKVSKRGKHPFGPGTLAWADQAGPTATARPSTRVPARAVASGSGKGEHPLRQNFPRKSFSIKTTFVHLDYVSGGVPKTSD
jgi:hypothetical protein